MVWGGFSSGVTEFWAGVGEGYTKSSKSWLERTIFRGTGFLLERGSLHCPSWKAGSDATECDETEVSSKYKGLTGCQTNVRLDRFTVVCH